MKLINAIKNQYLIKTSIFSKYKLIDPGTVFLNCLPARILSGIHPVQLNLNIVPSSLSCKIYYDINDKKPDS